MLELGFEAAAELALEYEIRDLDLGGIALARARVDDVQQELGIDAGLHAHDHALADTGQVDAGELLLMSLMVWPVPDSPT